MAGKLALLPQVPLRYEYPAFQELARRIEKRLDEIVSIGTEFASTSGTSIDFTGIPAWVTQIQISFVGVSTNGTSGIIVQLGDSGGIETTNYLGAGAGPDGGATYTNYSSGFLVSPVPAATWVHHGQLSLSLEDSSDNTWSGMGIIGLSAPTATLLLTAGTKATSAALDRVRITTAGGADTFDAGAINIRMS